MVAIMYHLRTDRSMEESFHLESDSLQMTGRNFRDALQLSPQQMDEFHTINSLFRQSARAINISLDKARGAMFIELKKESPDLEVCKRLSGEMGRLHKELKEITCIFYLDVRQLCNSEQEKKLEELFAPVFGSVHGYGFGNGYGRGQGGRFGRGRWGL